MGVNLGEAVNFAPPDWLRFGAAALGRLRHFRKPGVVSQEEMLLRVAAGQAAQAQAQAQRRASAAGGSGGKGALAQAGGSPTSPASPPSPSPAPGAPPSPLVAYYLRQELQRVVEEEWVLRGKLWSEGEGGSTSWIVSWTASWTPSWTPS
jgi:hypothetical protein